jgi:hypothetical protein
MSGASKHILQGDVHEGILLHAHKGQMGHTVLYQRGQLKLAEVWHVLGAAVRQKEAAFLGRGQHCAGRAHAAASAKRTARNRACTTAKRMNHEDARARYT